jgi:chromosome segregation ATPase
MPDYTAVAIAFASLIGVLVSTLQARGANKRASALEARKIDLDAAEDHWLRTDKIIERLSDEIERLDLSLRRTRELVEQGESENLSLRARLAQAEVRVARLRSIVAALYDEMKQHGLAIPEGVISGALDDQLGGTGF